MYRLLRLDIGRKMPDIITLLDRLPLHLIPPPSLYEHNLPQHIPLGLNFLTLSDRLLVIMFTLHLPLFLLLLREFVGRHLSDWDGLLVFYFVQVYAQLCEALQELVGLFWVGVGFLGPVD